MQETKDEPMVNIPQEIKTNISTVIAIAPRPNSTFAAVQYVVPLITLKCARIWNSTACQRDPGVKATRLIKCQKDNYCQDINVHRYT